MMSLGLKPDQATQTLSQNQPNKSYEDIQYINRRNTNTVNRKKKNQRARKSCPHVQLNKTVPDSGEG